MAYNAVELAAVHLLNHLLRLLSISYGIFGRWHFSLCIVLDKKISSVVYGVERDNIGVKADGQE